MNPNEDTKKETTLEPTNWADPTGEGIMAAMDKIFDAPIETKQDVVEVDIKVNDTPTSEKPVEEKTVTEEVSNDTVEDVIVENFFDDTEDKKEETQTDDAVFDESKFDKETEEAIVGMDVKAGDKFKALRAELKEAKKQVVSPDIEAKLQELELKAKEADGLRERLEEVSSQSAKLKVESSDEYLNDIVKPVSDMFQRVDQMAEIYGSDSQAIKAIIQEKDRKVQNQLISEHLGDFSDLDRSEVYRMIQDFGGLVAKRSAMLENADKEIERQQVKFIEAEKKALAEQKKAIQVIQKDIWEKYKEKIPGFIKDGSETDEYRKLMSKSLSIDFSQAKARDQAYAAFAGVAFPHVVNELNAVKKRLANYEKSDQKSLKGSPSPSSSISQTPSSQKDEGGFMKKFANMDFA